MRRSLGNLGQALQERGGEVANRVLTSALTVINVLVLVVLVPVITFYLLMDWDRMVAHVDGLLPRQHAPTIRRLARQVDRTMAGFVRGQGLVCLILGTYYAVTLMLVGLNFGLVVGFIAGMLTFIPYVGALVGGVLAIGLALVQFWGDWMWIVVVWAIFQSGQFVEGNFLTPKLVGDSVGLHPVWLIFALSVFGALFGFLGLLVAVPAAAAIGVLARFADREVPRERPLPRARGSAGRPVMARQMALDLPVRTARGRADFFVTPANAAALAIIDDPARWPAGRLVLAGPEGSGKSHLAQVWATATGAQVVPAEAIAAADVPALAAGPVVVEDGDRGATDEAALLHLLNLAAAAGHPLLLTARTPPAQWSLALPDLASRLEAASVIRLSPPDDDLLRAVLVKLFADRQIEVRPSLIDWLALRLDRSLAAAATAVDRLDRAALARGRPVTRALAAEVLDMSPPPDP